jgi:hypothetical protein
MASEMAEAQINVILVHGTVLFARFKIMRWLFRRALKPSWIEPHSKFIFLLNQELRSKGYSTIKVRRLRWFGGNSDIHRKSAATASSENASLGAT